MPASSPLRYRAVSLWAVLSLVFGGASAVMIFGWLLLPVPLAAVYFGLKAVGQIQMAPEEYSGLGLAKTGIGLGAFLGIVLSGYLLFFRSEVPHGCQVLDWADLVTSGNERVSLAALKLSDDKVRVYVRGYMLPGRRNIQLKEFSLCRTSDMCRFQRPVMKTSDLIHLVLAGDLTKDFTTHQVGVGGVFRVDAEAPGPTPYFIDVDYIYD